MLFLSDVQMFRRIVQFQVKLFLHVVDKSYH